MSMEIKSFAFESKVDLDKNTFEGYAAAFGNIDSHNDIIEQGAFAKTLKEAAKRIKVLWQHDFYSPIGLPMQMEEDSKGLYVKAKISQTTQGKDALILMKDGVINELSIGYNTIKHLMDEDTGVRTLKELKLLEFSPVTWASNDMATITSAKNNRQLEQLLKGLDVEGNEIPEELVKQAIKSLQALVRPVEPTKVTHKHTIVEPSNHSIIEDTQSIKELMLEMAKFRKRLGGI